MTLESIANAFGGGPQAAFIGILVLACLSLFVALMRSHGRELKTLEKGTALATALAPIMEKLKEERDAKDQELKELKARRRKGNTGAHTVVPEDTP